MTGDQFNKLAQMIKQVHDDIADRVDGMAADTEENFKKVDGRFANIAEKFNSQFQSLEEKMDHEFSHAYAELRSIRTDIASLDKERVGHTKETDYVLSRLAVIEKKLGITI